MKSKVIVCMMLAVALFAASGPTQVSANIFTDAADAIRRAVGTVDDYKKWISNKWNEVDDLQRMIRYIEYGRKKVNAIQDSMVDVANQINNINEENGVCDLTPILYVQYANETPSFLCPSLFSVLLYVYRVPAKVLFESIDNFELPPFVNPTTGFVNIGGHSQPNCYDANGAHVRGVGDVITVSQCPTDGVTCTAGKYYPDIGSTVIYGLCANATYGIYTGPGIAVDFFAYDYALYSDATCSTPFWPVTGSIHTADIRISATGQQQPYCTNATSVAGYFPPRLVTFDTSFTPSSACLVTPVAWTALLLMCTASFSLYYSFSD